MSAVRSSLFFQAAFTGLFALQEGGGTWTYAAMLLAAGAVFVAIGLQPTEQWRTYVLGFEGLAVAFGAFGLVDGFYVPGSIVGGALLARILTGNASLAFAGTPVQQTWPQMPVGEVPPLPTDPALPAPMPAFAAAQPFAPLPPAVPVSAVPVAEYLPPAPLIAAPYVPAPDAFAPPAAPFAPPVEAAPFAPPMAAPPAAPMAAPPAPPMAAPPAAPMAAPPIHVPAQPVPDLPFAPVDTSALDAFAALAEPVAAPDVPVVPEVPAAPRTMPSSMTILRASAERILTS